MSSLAVSLALVGAAGVGQGLSREDQAAWSRIRESVVLVRSNTAPAVPAACIDARGYFIVSRAALGSSGLTASLDSGLVVPLVIRSVDEVTQLALLVPSVPVTARFRPAEPIRNALKPGAKLFAVLGDKPVRADVASLNRQGVVPPERRVLPLAEFRFEALPQHIAGALVFTNKGELVGIVNATLPASQSREKSVDAQALSAENRLWPPAQLGGGAIAENVMRQFGPGGLTVAYSVAPSVLGRVIEGFRSPTHKAAHPTLGVFCKDHPSGGAEIQSITAGSPAESAGLQVGDIIVGIAGTPVRNQIEFATVMFQQKVGSKVAIKVVRGGEAVDVIANVGSSQGAEPY